MIKPFAASNEGHLCYGQSHNAWGGGGVRAKIIDGISEFRLIFEAAMLCSATSLQLFRIMSQHNSFNATGGGGKKESHRFETL